MAQKRIDFFGQFRPTGIDQTAGAQYRALAGLGEQVTNLAAQVGGQISTERGQEQALKDVQSGKKPEKQSSFTRYGQAYNKVAALAYEASVEQDTRERLAELKEQYKDDPEAFRVVADAHKEAVIEGLPTELAFSVGKNIEASVFSAYDSLSKSFQAKQTKEQIATIELSLDNNSTDILNAARDNQPEVVQEKIKSTTNILNEAKNAGLIDDSYIAAYSQNQAKEIYSETITGRFERAFESIEPIDVQIEKAKNVIQDASEKAPNIFKPSEVDSLVNRLNVKLNKKQSILNAEARVQDAQARKAAANYEKAVSMGIEVSPEQRASVYQLAANDEELTTRLATAERLSEFSVLSKDERDSTLTSLRSLDSVNEFESAQRINEKINKLAREDGYALGSKQGVIEATDLDISNPDSLATRIQQAELLSEHYGVPVSPITEQEALYVSNMINETATVQEKIEIAKTLNSAPNLWKQVAKKNQAAFSVAGASGDESLMQAVFTGQELLKNKLATAPSANEILPTLNDYVGNIYGTDDKTAIMQAAIAHYVATSNDGGVFDPDSFENSIDAVTGGIGKINGNKIQLPRGVDESDFEDFIDDMSPKFIESSGAIYGMTTDQTIEFIQRNNIISIGDNKYTVQRNGVTPPSASNMQEPFTFSYDPEFLTNPYSTVGRGR